MYLSLTHMRNIMETDTRKYKHSSNIEVLLKTFFKAVQKLNLHHIDRMNYNELKMQNLKVY